MKMKSVKIASGSELRALIKERYADIKMVRRCGFSFVRRKTKRRIRDLQAAIGDAELDFEGWELEYVLAALFLANIKIASGAADWRWLCLRSVAQNYIVLRYGDRVSLLRKGGFKGHYEVRYHGWCIRWPKYVAPVTVDVSLPIGHIFSAKQAQRRA